MVMDDRIVVVEEAAEGSYLARALGQSILLWQTRSRHCVSKGGRWGSSASALGTLAAILADVPAP